jgi:hypothetical protein
MGAEIIGYKGSKDVIRYDYRKLLKFVAYCGKIRRNMLQTWNGNNSFTMAD